MEKRWMDKAKKKLKENSEAYKVLVEKHTESPGTGKLLHNKKKGVYLCALCGNKLFDSKTKFDSGTGWPSFYDIANSKNVRLERDFSMILPRVEVLCARCGGHLGHVFSDAPQTPTGKRYCINSCALEFEEGK